MAEFWTLGGSTFMSISTRRKFGVLVVAVAVAAALAFLVVGIFRGTWHYVGSGSSGNGQWIAFSGELGVSEYYFIPILLCVAVGAFCLLWPARKPPKFNQ